MDCYRAEITPVPTCLVSITFKKWAEFDPFSVCIEVCGMGDPFYMKSSLLPAHITNDGSATLYGQIIPGALISAEFGLCICLLCAKYHAPGSLSKYARNLPQNNPQRTWLPVFSVLHLIFFDFSAWGQSTSILSSWCKYGYLPHFSMSTSYVW